MEENRFATMRPTIINTDKNQINNNYINDYSKYYGDRIRLRGDIFKIKQRIYDILEIKNPIILKDEWTFDDLPKNELKRLTLPQLQHYTSSIKNFIKYCKDNNIKCYISNMNRKDSFIRHYVGLNNNLIEQSNITKQLNNYLKEQKIDFSIIDLYALQLKLIKSQEQPLFYKTDHHQTQTLSFEATKQIITYIKNDFQNLQTPKENDYIITYNKNLPLYFHGGHGSACDFKIPIKKCPLNYNYKMFSHKKYNLFEYLKLKNGFDGFKYINKSNNNAPNIIIFSRSFGLDLINFFPFYFKNTMQTILWFSNLTGNGCRNDRNGDCFTKEVVEKTKMIANFKPDIILLFDSGLEYTGDFE